MMVDGIDLDTTRELDETSDEPWCYCSRHADGGSAQLQQQETPDQGRDRGLLLIG
jgi:hypothetical protein